METTSPDFGIFITVGFNLVVAVLIFRGILRGIRLIKPQERVMLMTLNNRKSARDVSNLFLVVATALQEIYRYPGAPQALPILPISLPVKAAAGRYNIKFRKIQPVVQIVDSVKAFHNAPGRRPLTAARIVILSQLTETLLDETWGQKFTKHGTKPLQDKLATEVNDIIKDWGCVLKRLDLGDVDPPKWEEEAVAVIEKSKAEVVAFQHEREAQRELYPYLQWLDPLKEIPQLRAIIMGGKEESMFGQVFAAMQAHGDEKKEEVSK